MPFLQSIIVFPDEMCTNLMIQDTFDRICSILNGKTDHNSTYPITIVMNNTRRCYSILDKLVSKH